MKKLSKINESLWSDMQDRNGMVKIRKEDDINLLDGRDMLEYIFNHYVIQDNFSQPQYHKDANVLNVPILKVKENRYKTSVNYITYDYDKDCIYIRETLYDEILIKIKKELNISSFWGGAYTIKDADNHLFIKLIDFIIDNVDPMSKTVFALLHKRKMNESLWSDMQDRNGMVKVRKEDDINLLDLEGLCDYLNKIYKSSSSVSKSICVQNFKPDTELCVSLYEDIDGYYRFLFYSGSVVNTQRDVLYELKCNKEIQQKYSLKQLKNDFGVETVDIYPKDGSPVNNEFFLEVLEFLLENIKEPYTKIIEKIEDVKESLWSDMQDRNGMVKVRKEDNIDLLDEEGLLAYLQKHYKINNCPLDIRIVHDNSDIEIPFCTAGYKNIKINALYYNCSSHTVFLRNDFYKYLPELHNKLKKEFQMTDNPNWPFYITISPKDNTEITNTFFIKFLEFVIDNMDNTVTPTITRRQVNESLWSDMQDRNGMVKVRKEDDINLLDENDFEKYLQDHYNVTNGYSIYNLGGITVPVLKSSFADEHTFALIYDGVCQDGIYISNALQDYYPQLYKELQKEFVLSHRGSIFNITPKSGEKCTNKFCIEVLDFIIDHAKKDLIIEKK